MIPPLFALFSWPIVSLFLFLRQNLQYAIVTTLIAGYLLLPEVVYYNLAMLPTLDKQSIPSIATFVLALSFATQGQGRIGWLPKGLLPSLLLIGFLFSGFFTAITNTDAIQIGARVLAGLSYYDSVSSIIGALIVVLPLLLARKYLSDTQGHRVILIVFMISALCYAPLAWIELRLSPQMNNWVYGFFPHSWVQHIRASGYRPVVFLEHGLRLSIFLSLAVIAALALSRTLVEKRSEILFAAGFLFLTLVFSKSLGALIITLVLFPLVFFCSTRTQLMAAAVLGGMILLYPMARTAGVIPVDTIHQTIETYNPDRAASLGARLENEEALLERAAQRPIFGWGGWGRSRVYSELGQDITIADGYWIISFGIGGWTRYITEFGLMIIPLLFLVMKSRKLDVQPETAALSLIMIANLTDMIPNSSMTPLTWLVAGALWGRLEAVESESSRQPSRSQSAERLDLKMSRPFAKAEVGDEAVTRSPPLTRYTRQTARKDRTSS